jgi:CRISPR-associated protein Csx3
MEITQWQKFCDELILPVVALIESNYLGTKDHLESYAPILIGSVHHLERGEDISSRPVVRA